ncbi:MAG: glycoside hydrolase family 3 N-terminal domain-containing protein [Chthoniobacterales bacterium]
MSSIHRGQLLLVGVPGKMIDSETADLIRRTQPGGFILFGRNIESPEQLRQLTDDLRSLSKVEPIITIDQEGGRVSRLKLIGQEPPNAQQLREKGDRTLICRHGELTAALLRIFGFNLDLCPVLDISFDDEADNSLRGRCYGTDVAQVIDFAGAFNSALRSGGILSCGKHFPGYSSATNDPHHELPVLDRSRELMEAHELAVFRHFADKIDSMMIGHINYSGLDSGPLPASLSPAIIHDLLRQDMKFCGLVMTDDLDMGAILNHYSLEQTLRLALEAGNDLLMICHRTHLAEEALLFLNTLPDSDVETALANIAEFKKKMSPPTPFDVETFTALDKGVWDLRVATLGEERAAQRSPEDGKRSPVEIY